MAAAPEEAAAGTGPGTGTGRAGGGRAAGPSRLALRLPPAAGVQGGRAVPADAEMRHSSAVPHADLRPQPRGCQVPVLVLRVPAEEDEEVFGRDRVLRAGARWKS